MTASRLLLRLYPPAFRERWGEDLCAEADRAGWRYWPNLVTGALDLWLHPAIWPTAWPAQRNSRTAALAILVTTACWLVAHLTTEPGARAYAIALDACSLVLAAGLALLTPLPRVRALDRLLVRSVRLLTVPVLLGAAAVLTVHVVPHLAGLVAWWTAWGLVLIQGARAVAGLGPDVVVPPSLTRTRLGVAVLTGASAGAAGTIAVFAALDPAPLPALIGIAAVLSSVASGAAGRDLVPG
jgi:hypothetical protein